MPLVIRLLSNRRISRLLKTTFSFFNILISSILLLFIFNSFKFFNVSFKRKSIFFNPILERYKYLIFSKFIFLNISKELFISI